MTPKIMKTHIRHYLKPSHSIIFLEELFGIDGGLVLETYFERAILPHKYQGEIDPMIVKVRPGRRFGVKDLEQVAIDEGATL